MKLAQECSLTATLRPPLPIGAGPIAARLRTLPELGVEDRVWRPA